MFRFDLPLLGSAKTGMIDGNERRTNGKGRYEQAEDSGRSILRRRGVVGWA